mgnify:CR=1 FL=1
MRPVSPTARKAGAALAALMLSTALTACQPDSSTASAATPTSVPTPTDQASAPASPGGSTGGSSNSTDNPGGSGNSTDSPNGSTDGWAAQVWSDRGAALITGCGC